METAAKHFDLPIDSKEHSELRNTAWIGGSLFEGKYLLSILFSVNLFRCDKSVLVELHRKFLLEHFSEEVVEIFGDGYALELETTKHYLRLIYSRRDEFPKFDPPESWGPPRKKRVELAVEIVLKDLDISNADLAKKLDTTEKQVLRLAEINWIRTLVSRHRKRDMD